jgi:hypothetical protein
MFRKRGDTMNFHNKKTRKVLSTVIIIVLVLAMIVPVLLSAIL